MPSQMKIISRVNNILSRNRGVEIRFDPGGVCAGLAGLYAKYSLEGNGEYFLAQLEQLAKLPEDYKLGTNKKIDKFETVYYKKILNLSQWAIFRKHSS